MSCTRRSFLATTGLVAAWTPMVRAAYGVGPAADQAASPPPSTRMVDTPTLRVAYEEQGAAQGFPIVLLHGFPDDAHAWDDVTPALARAGYRTLAPYLRGYGDTRFRDADAPRMAQQAAIGQDLIDFADAMGLRRFAVAGYDWGGRAACIAAALQPDRVRAALLIGGYTIQNTIDPPRPASPETERALWYQWYFNTERGRAGLAANRRPLCRLLWQTWSPTWTFDDRTYDRTAASFDNPDFVDVVIHSYRHRNGAAAGEPRFADVERRLAKAPPIPVPTLTLFGADDGVARPAAVSPNDRTNLPALKARRIIPGAGHFLPRERPEVVSSAMLELLAGTPER